MSARTFFTNLLVFFAGMVFAVILVALSVMSVVAGWIFFMLVKYGIPILVLSIIVWLWCERRRACKKRE